MVVPPGGGAPKVYCTAMINDAHCHFFSARFFAALANDPAAPAVDDPAIDLPARLGWEAPGSPERLADRWIAELDRHDVSRAAVMASVPGDESSVAAAVARHPERLVGSFMLDPTAADAPARAAHAFSALGLRCACLFPAMHRFTLDDDRVAAIFDQAAAHAASVFVHCGVLSVGVRKKLGLPSQFDIRRGDPLALMPVAAAYPSVATIIPHFGAGFLRETLMAADLCPNIHIDTSSSNVWTRYVAPTTLADAFRQTLDVVGAGRVLFGSDSSFFPRGWQQPLHATQRETLAALGVDDDAQRAIFSDNFDRVFGTGSASARS